MTMLPDHPGDQLKLLTILALVGAGAIYWTQLHAPRSAVLAVQERRLGRLVIRSAEQEARAESLRAVRLRGAEEGSRIRVLRGLIAKRGEIPAIHAEVVGRARKGGLALLRVSPREVGAGEGEYLHRHRWELVLEGNFHSLGRYVAEIASLDRLLRPSVTAVEPAGTPARGVRAQLELDAFLLPPAADSPAVSGRRSGPSAAGGTP